MRGPVGRIVAGRSGSAPAGNGPPSGRASVRGAGWVSATSSGSAAGPTGAPAGDADATVGTGAGRRSRNQSTATPARVPRIEGQALLAPAPGRVSAAHTPTTPKAMVPAMPIQSRRTDATPSTTEITTRVTVVPAIRASLSFSPNVRM